MKAATTLRVHVARERIWTQATESEPILFPGSVPEFIAEVTPAKYDRIRLTGALANAFLITQLYEAKQQQKIASVEVCTPAIVEKRADRSKPGPVLFELGLCPWSPSQGGFHEVVENDYRAYMLAAAAWAVDGPMYSDDMLQCHPGWKALQFLQPSRAAVTAILGNMIDPRWYIDPCYPDRPGKFYEALGLNMRTQANVTNNPIEYVLRVRRRTPCYYTRECWKMCPINTSTHAIKELCALASYKPVANSKHPGLRPQDFCWRTWSRLVDRDPVKADLRASQRFADFLRQTWLNELYSGAASVPEERAVLFRPADFFKHEEEVHAYEQFIAGQS